jgi:hypothetical protein
VAQPATPFPEKDFGLSMTDHAKDLLIQALCSGKVIQNAGSLRRFNKFCPLGVLCELHRLETKTLEWQLVGNGRYAYGGSAFFLPKVVRVWAGLAEADPRLGCATVSHWNDVLKVSLPRIAELVERYL